MTSEISIIVSNKSKYEKVGILPIQIVKSNVLSLTLISVSAVHQPFYISICISTLATLPTQDTFMVSNSFITKAVLAC